MYRPEQDRFLVTQGELESRIQTLLAGTVAEEIVFDDVSSGAQNDLERATEIARGMVMEYGMSRLGRVNYRESNRSPFLVTGEVSRMQTHSEHTAREIDQEVKRIIDEGLQRTRHILESRRAALVAISEELIKMEVIDSVVLKRLIEASSPSAMLVPGTDVDGKRRVTMPPKPAKDIDSSDMERAEGE
jgi:cell division protease FtsH